MRDILRRTEDTTLAQQERLWDFWDAVYAALSWAWNWIRQNVHWKAAVGALLIAVFFIIFYFIVYFSLKSVAAPKQ